MQGNVKFQLDTAATCNMLTRRDYTMMGEPKMTATKTPVTLYDDSTVMPDGWCTISVALVFENRPIALRHSRQCYFLAAALPWQWISRPRSLAAPVISIPQHVGVVNSNNKHHLNFLVMNTGQHSLLSLNTCLDLSLIKMNESVHLVSVEPLENILTQYENVFHCIR